MENLYEELMSHGFCNILAQELNKQFGFPLQAAIDYDYDVEDKVLVHMWNVLPSGENYDAKGIMPININQYLIDNYEELDEFKVINNHESVIDLINYWNEYLPLPSKNDYLQSDGNPVLAQQYLDYHIEVIKERLNGSK